MPQEKTGYHLLICDDEWIMREGIAAAAREIPNLEVSMAGSGAQALDCLKKEAIDGVILDICMPVISGLDVLKALRQDLKLDIPVVILSGHDEFEYAQSALEHGAGDYVLKPIPPDLLRGLFDKLLGLIDKQRSTARELCSLKEEIERIRPRMRDRYFTDLLDGLLEGASLEEIRPFLAVPQGAAQFRIALLEFSGRDPAWRQEAYLLALYKATERLQEAAERREGCCFFHISSHISALLLYDALSEEPAAAAFLEQAVQSMDREQHLACRAGLGSCVSLLSRVRGSYREALQALRCDTDTDVTMVFIRDISRSRASSRYEKKEEILTYLRMGEAGQARERLERFFQEEEGSGGGQMSLDEAILFCLSVLLAAMEWAERMDCPEEEVFSLLGGNPAALLAIQRTPEALYQKTSDYVGSIFDFVRSSREKQKSRLIFKAKKLVGEQFRREVGVSELAQQLGLSKNYFGQLFKGETGMSVGEYVNHVRMEQAKILLRDPTVKIYEVANQVGFTDHFYFSSVFKKTVGVSPKDYREG